MTRLPVGGVWVYRRCCGGIDREFWESLPARRRIFRDRSLDAWVCVDLADARGRSHFFLGSFYDPANSIVIEAWLRPGDTFVDVGASLGFHSLHASRVVGELGRVIGFEPHPDSFALLQAHVTMNRIVNCEIHPEALGDEDGDLTLSEVGSAIGTATLRTALGAKGGRSAKVVRGDRRITLGEDGRVLIKIDVEGFEHRALRGLGRLLERPRLALGVEITDTWLKETGSSSASLFEEMRRLGFAAFHPVFRRRGLRRSIELMPLAEPLPLFQYDVFFFRPDEVPDSLTVIGS